ncbi:MAG: hypothetical protein ACK56B_04935, partial [Dolichospermum sp.]
MNLGELIVELSADSSELEKTLERAKKKAYEAAKAVEKSFKDINLSLDNNKTTKKDNLSSHLSVNQQRLKKTNDYFKSNPITPVVNDSQLTILNERLSLEAQHLKQVNKHFDNNPINVNVNSKNLDELNRRLNGLSSKTIAITAESKLSKQLEKSLTDAVKDAVKESNRGKDQKSSSTPVQQQAAKEVLSSRKTQNVNVVANPVSAALNGIFQEIGKQFIGGLDKSAEDIFGANISGMARKANNAFLRYFGLRTKTQANPGDAPTQNTQTESSSQKAKKQKTQVNPDPVSASASISEKTISTDKLPENQVKRIVQNIVVDFAFDYASGNLSQQRTKDLLARAGKQVFKKVVIPYINEISESQSSTGQSSTGQSSTSKKISRASQRAFEILKEAGQPAPQKSAPQQADQVLKPQSHVPENKNVEKIFQKSNKSQQPVATSSDLENAAQLLINAANILANSATINASQKPKKTKSELESDKKTNKLLVEVKTASSEIKQAAVNLNKTTKGFNDSINKIKAASLEIKQSANDLKNAAQLLANAVNVLTGSTQSAINSASDPKKPKSTNNDAELLQPKQDVLPKVKQQLDLAQSNIAKGLNNTVESLSNTAKAAKDFVQSQINQKINASLPSNAEQKTPLQLPTEQAQQLQQPVNIPQKSTKNEDITVLEPLPLELKQNINSVRLNTAKNIVASKRFVDATNQEGNAQLVPQKPINIEKINTKKQTSLDTTRDVFEIINDYFTAEYKKLKADVDRAKKSGNLEDIDATRNKLKNFASHTEKAVTDIDAIVKQAEDQGYQKYINSELTDVHSKGKSPIRRKTKLANEMIGSLNYAEGQILEKDRKNYVAQAEKAGIEIPEGLKRGIVSNFDGVSAETKKLLNDFIKVVKKQLGIQSPSLVMFEIGMMIASGLFFGMQKGNSKVSEGARKMVTTIKSAFDPLNDLSSLGLAGTYMIPNLSDISNKAMIA